MAPSAKLVAAALADYLYVYSGLLLAAVKAKLTKPTGAPAS